MENYQEWQLASHLPYFVKAVQVTGRLQLIVAGGVADVSVAFATLSAFEASYDVFVVTDASGTYEDLKQFEVPTRILHSDDDQIVPIGAAARASATLVPHNNLEGLSGGPPRPARVAALHRVSVRCTAHIDGYHGQERRHEGICFVSYARSYMI
jgi:pimeloyl-ACP methyl ester carboxylesterase